MKILQYVTDLWTMNITFYKEKLNPLSSLMTGATYWCKKQTAIVLVSDRQRNAASQKLSKPMILARYFIHAWIGVTYGKGQVGVPMFQGFGCLNICIETGFSQMETISVLPKISLKEEEGEHCLQIGAYLTFLISWLTVKERLTGAVKSEEKNMF